MFKKNNTPSTYLPYGYDKWLEILIKIPIIRKTLLARPLDFSDEDF